MSKPKPKVGDLWRRGNAVRSVVALYSDIRGGVRLSRPIEGFVSWNTEELEFVQRAKGPLKRQIGLRVDR